MCFVHIVDHNERSSVHTTRAGKIAAASYENIYGAVSSVWITFQDRRRNIGRNILENLVQRSLIFARLLKSRLNTLCLNLIKIRENSTLTMTFKDIITAFYSAVICSIYIFFKFISSSFFRKLQRSIFFEAVKYFKVSNYNVNNFVNVINFIRDTLVKGYFTCSHRIFTRRQLTMVRSTAIPSSLFTHHLFRILVGFPLYSWYPRNFSTYRRKGTRKTYKITRWKYSRETIIRAFAKGTLR